MNITSFDKAKKNEELLIPGFTTDEKISITVRRPNLLSLVMKGGIPNELMSVARSLVIGNFDVSKKISDEEKLDNITKSIEVYLRAVMVEPAYEEVSDLLTDEQVVFIQQWATAPTKELSSFREDAEDGSDNRDGSVVQEKTE